MITGANTRSGGCWRGGGCPRSDQRRLTPNCENADSGRDLRDDDRCDFVGDNGLGLVVVDVDCLKGAHVKRLPAVGHPVAVDTLQWRRCGHCLRCGTGSCTHAPQAAVNDIAGGLRNRKQTHSHTCTQAGTRRQHIQNIRGGTTRQSEPHFLTGFKKISVIITDIYICMC